MTIQDVARHLEVSWDVIKDIQKAVSQAAVFQPSNCKTLRQIAIDEITIGRGQRYLTVVLDWTSGAVVFVGQGKGGDALLAILEAAAPQRGQRLRPWPRTCRRPTSRPSTTTCPRRHWSSTASMSSSSSTKNCPTCGGRCTTRSRIQCKRQVLKGIRWLLLKTTGKPRCLAPNEQKRLEEALRLNKPLATAYYLKEELARVLGTGSTSRLPKRSFRTGFARAETTGIRMLIKLRQNSTVPRLRPAGLLRLSRSPPAHSEGTNNKIKTMKRQAYGFRDQEFFKLKILGISTKQSTL